MDMMKENILFLVHVEEMFRSWFPDNMYALRLRKACTAEKYSRVFIMVSHVDGDYPIDEVDQVTYEHQYIDWAWGYEQDQFSHDPSEQRWVIPASGHEYTWVPPEVRDMVPLLRMSNVFLGGGCEAECLQDFCDVLDHVEVPFEKISGYVY